MEHTSGSDSPQHTDNSSAKITTNSKAGDFRKQKNASFDDSEAHKFLPEEDEYQTGNDLLRGEESASSTSHSQEIDAKESQLSASDKAEQEATEEETTDVTASDTKGKSNHKHKHHKMRKQVHQSSEDTNTEESKTEIDGELQVGKTSQKTDDCQQETALVLSVDEEKKQSKGKGDSSSKAKASSEKKKKKGRKKRKGKKRDKADHSSTNATAENVNERDMKSKSTNDTEEKSEHSCAQEDLSEIADVSETSTTSKRQSQNGHCGIKETSLRHSELMLQRAPDNAKKSGRPPLSKEKRSNTLRAKMFNRTVGMKTFSNEMMYNISHVIMHDKTIVEWFDDPESMESGESILVNDITVFTFDVSGHIITVGVRLDSSPINLESGEFSIPSPLLYEMEGQEQTDSPLFSKSVKVRRDGTVESGTIDGLISFLVDPLKDLDDDFTTSLLFTHKFIISTEEFLDLLLQIYKSPLPIKDKAKYRNSKHILDYVEEIRLRVLKFLIRWSSETPTILTKQNIERIYDFVLELKPCHEIVGIYICRCLDNVSTSLRVRMDRVRHFKSRELSVKEVRMLMSLFSLDHTFDDDYFLMLLRGSSFSEKQVYKGQSYDHMFIGSDILVIASMNLSLPSARVGIMAEALSARKDSPIRVLAQVNSNSAKDQFRAFHRLHKAPSNQRAPGQGTLRKNHSEYFGSGLQAENLPTTTFALLGYEDDVLRRSPFQSTIFRIKNATEFNILDIDSTEFARQLARYHHSLLRNVTLEELSKPTIGKRGHENEYVNVQECKQRSNQFLSWVLTYILTKKNLSQRAKVMEKFIDICTKCEQLGDFCSVIVFSFAFNQQVICRLKKTMAKLSPEVRAKYSDIADYLGGGNPLKYRKKMKEIRPPFIPSFILVFGDIEKINEQPTFYDDDEHRVRFDKLRCLSGFIQTVNYSRKSVYQYAENITLTNVFPNLKGIDDPNLLREMSKHLED